MTRRMNAMSAALIALAQVGCYRTSAGTLLRTEPLPGSERVVRDSLVLRVDGDLTPMVPVIRARVIRQERVRVEFQEVRQAIQAPSHFLNGLGAMLLVAAGGAAIWQGSTMRDPRTDSVTTAGVGLIVTGGVSILAGAGLIKWAFGTGPALVAGKTLPGRRSRQENVREDKGVPGVTVQARLDGIERNFKTDANGTALIDLVTDFGLKSFSTVRRIPLTVVSPTTRSSETIGLSSASWTLPCVRTSAGRNGQVHELARAQSRTLGSYSGGQTYRLRDTTQVDWFGIEYRASLGWIPRLDATQCWFSPIDSTTDKTRRTP
jgi:hypothetical protein